MIGSLLGAGADWLLSLERGLGSPPKKSVLPVANSDDAIAAVCCQPALQDVELPLVDRSSTEYKPEPHTGVTHAHRFLLPVQYVQGS